MKMDLQKKKSKLKENYINRYQNFILSSKDCTQQYYRLYLYRLKEMTKLLKDKVKKKWGSEYSIKKLCDLREDREEKCIIIGTLFKHQELKPSILREICEEMQLDPQPPPQHYVGPNDKLILEDELQRIRLIGKIDPNYLVTGVVCAVLGFVETDGKFFVEDILFYESEPQKPLKSINESPLIVFMSGLDQSSTNDVSLSLALFKEWLLGNANSFNKNPNLNSSDVFRIVVAGNSVRSSKLVKEKVLQTRKVEDPNELNAITLLDNLFESWSHITKVDVMPGKFDPSNYLFPQQPFHPCLFSKSSKISNFKSVSNPYGFESYNRYILGTSGQNIKDIMCASNIDNPIEALRSTIIWSHISPTSPDTLPCFPYIETDPFIIDECPHVYFCGNQAEFKTAILKDENGKTCRLISIPSFIKTQSVAVVNLKTLECFELNFKVDD